MVVVRGRPGLSRDEDLAKVSEPLNRAFPLPKSGAFDDLLKAIDEREQRLDDKDR